MKLTKYVHACLLAETPEMTVLFDPGKFSWESGTFDVKTLERLNAVVITHEHFDHFHMPFVNALLEKFPTVQFVTTESVATQLQNAGISNISTESTDSIEIFSKRQHASLAPFSDAPQNIAVHFADYLTVGGDRHDLEESKQVLALTITAPWGSMNNAARMAEKLSPKKIVPVHDWHWNDAARQSAYDQFAHYFGELNITFIKPADGRSFEV